MVRPPVWVDSSKFVATPIMILNDWVTHIELHDDDNDLAARLLQYGFKQTKPLDGNPTYGYRGILAPGDWSKIDDSCELVPFSETQIFFVDRPANEVTPDFSTILHFGSRLLAHDRERFVELADELPPEQAWDILSEADIDPENAELWERFLVAYCSEQGGEPEAFDLMRGIVAAINQAMDRPPEHQIVGTLEPQPALENVSEAVSGEEGQDETPIVALAGTDIFWEGNDGVQVRRLARTLYRRDDEAVLINPEPLWVEGAPISRHQVVPVAKISLTPMTVSPVRESFSHPVPFEHSLDQLAGPGRVYAEHNMGPGYNYWEQEYRALLLDPEFETDVQQLLRAREYVEHRIHTSIGLPGVILTPARDGFVLRAKNVQGHYYHLVTGTLPEPNYVMLVDKYIAGFEAAKRRNQTPIQRLQDLGVDVTDVFDQRTLLAEGVESMSMAELLAINHTDLSLIDPEGECPAVVKELWFSMQVPCSGNLNFGTGYLKIYRTPSGQVVGLRTLDAAITNAMRRIMRGDALVGKTVEEVLQYAQAKEDIDTEALNRLIVSAKTMDLEQAVVPYVAPGIDTSGEADDPEQLARIIDYVSVKVKSWRALDHASDKWLERKVREIALQLNSQEGVVLVANKSKYVFQNLTRSDLWERYDGDRDTAYKFKVAELKERRGFRSGMPLVLDRLEALDPEAYQAIVRLREEADRPVASAKAQVGERQDTGYVEGYARKDLYQMNNVDMEKAISRTDPSKWLDMVKVSSVWPKPKREQLEREAGCREAAFVALKVREALPSSFNGVTKSPALVSGYIQAVQGLRQTVHRCESLDEAIKAAHTGLAELGITSHERTIRYNGLWSDIGARQSRRSRNAIWNYLYGYTGTDARGTILRELESLDDPWSFAGLTSAEKKSADAKIHRRSLADIPALAKIEREGPDWRQFGVVTELDLIRTFGFSGVEYGNWTNQKEREAYMAFTYDAFADLADLAKIPKAAMSLGGRLGLTFGSRGRGGRKSAMAHFEPANMAIALTREKGAGSLGHEYFHALANYFFRQFTAGSVVGDLNEVVHSLIKRSSYDSDFNVENSGGMRRETFAAFSRLYWALTHCPPSSGSWDDIQSASDINDVKMPKTAAWVESSVEQDVSDGRKKPYWGTPTEMFARGMEAWVVSSLEWSGRKNDYLVRDARISTDKEYPHRVYPTGKDHLRVIGLAVDNLFSTIKLENTLVNHPIGEEMTMPVMYSHWGSCRMTDPGILAEAALSEIREMLGANVALVIEHGQLTDTTGHPVAGQWLNEYRAIRLSSELADMGTVRHESYHAAKSMMMSESEASMMDRAFAAGQPAYQSLVESLRERGKGYLEPIVASSTEEAQAYAFQLYCDGELTLPPDSDERRLFQRILDFIKETFNICRDYGFKRPAELFEALREGELLARSIELKAHEAGAPSVS